MNRFYRVAIDKRLVGTVIEHREPTFTGQRVTKVTDTRTRGDFKVVVMDATDDEHQKNLALPGVEELAETEAVDLAAEFQPATTREERDPTTGKVNKIKVPAVDLNEILLQRAERSKSKAKSPDG